MAKRVPSERVRLRNEAKAKLRSYLKGTGLRATRQREVVLECFLDADSHISIEELYERIRRKDATVGHATVYRSMSLFVEAGIAKERRFHEGCVRYERGVDVVHHDHLVCLACGDIQEFQDPTIEEIQSEIAGNRGFLVRYHRLELYGLCVKCQREAATEKE